MLSSCLSNATALRRGCASALWTVAFASVLLLSSVIPAGAGDGLPRSSLNRPDGEATVFLLGFGGLGSAPDGDGVRAGGGGELIFRPNAAADIYRPLFDWNTAFVLQGEVRSVAHMRSLGTIDLILRRYTRDMRRSDTASSPFFGAGIGVGRGKLPVTVMAESSGEPGEEVAGETTVESIVRRDLTYLVEAGWEWSPTPGVIMLAKAQWRYFASDDMEYSNGALLVGAGVPVPW